MKKFNLMNVIEFVLWALCYLGAFVMLVVFILTYLLEFYCDWQASISLQVDLTMLVVLVNLVLIIILLDAFGRNRGLIKD